MHKIDEVQVVCVAEFHALEGKSEELIAALHSLIQPTHQEEGCLRYELNRRADDPRWVTFIEKWQEPGDIRRPLRQTLHHALF